LSYKSGLTSHVVPIKYTSCIYLSIWRTVSLEGDPKFTCPSLLQQ